MQTHEINSYHERSNVLVILCTYIMPMCGIIVSNGFISDNHKRMLQRRGPDASMETSINGFTFISTQLFIRKKASHKSKDVILLYNGEIYNDADSDTDFVHDCLNKIGSCCANCFCAVKKMYNMINVFENELVICFYMNDNIFFFKDDIGRRSFGYTLGNAFYAGSVSFENEANPNLLYRYQIKDNKLFFVPKNDDMACQEGTLCCNQQLYPDMFVFERTKYASIVWNDELELTVLAVLLENMLIESCRRRKHQFTPALFFSGGIDSLVLAMVLNKTVDEKEPIVLINTSFGDRLCWDRQYGKHNYEILCKNYTERKFIFVENDVSIESLKDKATLIKQLVYPKQTVMDWNIGSCHYFSAKAAKEYTKVVYSGAGADELFGGYAKYSGDAGQLKWYDDIKKLYTNNLGRDDRVVSDNSLELRTPFLDRTIVEFALQIYNGVYARKRKSSTSIRDKAILRKILYLNNFRSESEIAKKAAQFGSGIKHFEKRMDKT